MCACGTGYVLASDGRHCNSKLECYNLVNDSIVFTPFRY